MEILNLEEEAEKVYPKDLHYWAKDQFDDLSEPDRNIWKAGATSDYAKQQVILGQIKVLEELEKEYQENL